MMNRNFEERFYSAINEAKENGFKISAEDIGGENLRVIIGVPDDYSGKKEKLILTLDCRDEQIAFELNAAAAMLEGFVADYVRTQAKLPTDVQIILHKEQLEELFGGMI